MEIDHGETEVTTMRSTFWTSLRFANQVGGAAIPSGLLGDQDLAFIVHGDDRPMRRFGAPGTNDED
ncbi:MAG: hypothetical protein DHS20C11_28280 [Lysobacteraceae bacterium]|nr:MAG: hypothetical protein DHS20C11_28280 [Xanthomonadaceae bacterium]